MSFFSITKTRRPRQFEYTPRYYNPRKERLEAIVARAQQPSQANSAELATARLELAFREARERRKKRIAKAQGRRILLIVGALLLLLYLYIRL